MNVLQLTTVTWYINFVQDGIRRLQKQTWLFMKPFTMTVVLYVIECLVFCPLPKFKILG